MVFGCVFKQKTAYEMRISDWSSDVCSSDLKVTGSFVIAQKAVLGEKGKACGFCGFTSNSNETYPTDGNFREVSVDRLKPVCPHCNAYLHVRSEERRVGKESVRTGRYRLSLYH